MRRREHVASGCRAEVRAAERCEVAPRSHRGQLRSEADHVEITPRSCRARRRVSRRAGYLRGMLAESSARAWRSWGARGACDGGSMGCGGEAMAGRKRIVQGRVPLLPLQPLQRLQPFQGSGWSPASSAWPRGRSRAGAVAALGTRLVGVASLRTASGDERCPRGRAVPVVVDARTPVSQTSERNVTILQYYCVLGQWTCNLAWSERHTRHAAGAAHGTRPRATA